MCGRFTVNVKKKDLEEEWNLAVPPEYRPERNISPGRLIYAVTSDNLMSLNQLYWGKRVVLANNQSKFLINARIESVIEKPMYSKVRDKHRCLIPFSEYYEWKNGKVFSFQPSKKSRYFLGALFWPESQNKDLLIITQEANSQVAPFHHRMPLIFEQHEGYNWIKEQNIRPTTFFGKLDIKPIIPNENNRNPNQLNIDI